MADSTLKLKLLVSIGLICLYACVKPEKSLPAKTHEGKNIFGYERYNEYQSDKISGHTTPDSILHHPNGDFELKLGFNHNLYFSLTNTVNDFELDSINYNLNHNFDSSQINYCHISFHDEANKILSGSFEFNLKGNKHIDYVNYDSIQTPIDTVWNYDRVRLMNGRFDLKY